MTDTKQTYVPCTAPGCHSLSYVVMYDKQTRTYRVQCAACGQELLDGSRASTP